MKTLVLYYSYTGHTKALAQTLAEREAFDIAEIKDKRRPGKLKAYVAGCFASLSGKAWPIQPLECNLADYDRLILFSPVWAGNLPPVVNTVLKLLPNGKAVSVKMVSMSGESACRQRIEAMLEAKGGTLESFEDMQSPS